MKKAFILSLAAVVMLAVSCGDANKTYVSKAVRIMDLRDNTDGSMLVLTTGCDVARTGEVFCDDPIEVDVYTETPLEDAVEWIANN